MKKRNPKWNIKPFCFVFLGVFFIFISFSFAKTDPILCRDLDLLRPASSSKPTAFFGLQLVKDEARIKQHVQRKIKEFGKDKVRSRYDGVHGLLQLAHELSYITDNMTLIHETMESILDPFYFRDLGWDASFPGTRDELEKVVNGLFWTENLLRYNEENEEKEYIFRLDTGESFPISGEEGFKRFTDKLFLGKRAHALRAAILAIQIDRLEHLEWDQAFYLKAGYKSHHQERRELLKSLNSPSAFERRIRDLFEDDLHLFLSKIMQQFFEQEIDISSRRSRSDGRRGYSVSFHHFSSEEKEKLEEQGFIPNKQGLITLEIGAIFTSDHVPDGPFLFMHRVPHLTLLEVEEFVKKLRVIRFLERKYPKKVFVGAIFFAQASQEVIDKVNEEGLLLFRIPELPKETSEITTEEIEQENDKKFRLSRF